MAKVKDTKIREALAFEDLTPEEKEKRGILGRLYGPCASIAIPTRNGRMYSESLWDNQFESNNILKELFANGGVPMELDHPTDREETDSNRIAAMMPEPPKKDKDGHLITYCDIIDTPCGRIAYQLAKYGFKLGISSRGTGDVITDDEGNESVDPDTFDLTTFDLVLVPAVEDARLSMIESLNKTDTKVLNLKKALQEELDKATPDAKKVMEETLQTLNIDLEKPNNDSTSLNENVNIHQENENSKETIDETKEANNNGSEELIKSLQESLMKSAELEQKVKMLQEQLAVSNAEVSKLNEEGSKYKSTIVNLTRQVKEAKDTNKKIDSSLAENLKLQESKIKTLEEENQKLKESRDSTKLLRESISSRTVEIKKLKESLSSKDAQLKEVNEELLKEKQNSSNKINELTETISKTRRVVENYKKLANSASDKYIGLRAKMLGIDSQVIKNNLKESYTLQDIDDVCERLQGEEVNLGRLPFRVGKSGVVKVNESKQVINPKKEHVNIYDDDYVDEGLMKVAGIMK